MKYLLRLFVTGKTPRAELAIANVQRICEQELKGQYQLEIINVLEHPDLAESDKILATPTLIKQLPPPLRRVIGDLTNKEKVPVRSGSAYRRTAIQRAIRNDEMKSASRDQKAADGDRQLDILAKGGLAGEPNDAGVGHGGKRQDGVRNAVPRCGIAIQVRPGVFVTFEESAADIRKNMSSFGWDLEGWEASGKLAFVDASPDPEIEVDRSRRI